MKTLLETEKPAGVAVTTTAGEAEKNAGAVVSTPIVAQGYTESPIARLARCYEYILSDAWGQR